MSANSLPEPTLADVLTELKSFKAEVTKRFNKFEADVDQRFNQFEQRLDKLEYKFNTYESASDKVLRLATTIVIVAATVAVLPFALQAIGLFLTQIITAGQ